MTPRRRAIVAGIGAVLLIAGLAGWGAIQLSTVPADPQDSSMFELRQRLTEIPGVDDAGLLYPLDGSQFVGTNQGASIVLEIHEGEPGGVEVLAAVDQATCQVWLEMFFEPSFVWAAVVRAESDFVGPEGIGAGEWLKPFTILSPVDISPLADQLGAGRYENGYLKWTPAALADRCGPWVDPHP